MSDFNDDTAVQDKLVPMYELTLIKNRPELGIDESFEQLTYTYHDYKQAFRDMESYSSQGWEVFLKRIQ